MHTLQEGKAYAFYLGRYFLAPYDDAGAHCCYGTLRDRTKGAIFRGVTRKERKAIDSKIQIISARKANRYEQKQFAEYLKN